MIMFKLTFLNNKQYVWHRELIYCNLPHYDEGTHIGRKRNIMSANTMNNIIANTFAYLKFGRIYFRFVKELNGSRSECSDQSTNENVKNAGHIL